MADVVTLRAARGAITVADDSRDAVLDATERLLREMLDRNAVSEDDVVSVLFTATDDITSVFPAEAARRIGLVSVALICMRGMTETGGSYTGVDGVLHLT